MVFDLSKYEGRPAAGMIIKLKGFKVIDGGVFRIEFDSPDKPDHLEIRTTRAKLKDLYEQLKKEFE